MNQLEHEEIAELLLEAYASREPVEPLTAKFAGLTLDGRLRDPAAPDPAAGSTAGARIKGHKVGLTSAAMQRQLGVDQPDYGHLLDDMFWLEHEPIPTARFLQPRVEPEVAFVLKPRAARARASPSPRRSPPSDFVLPALEIIDSRIRDWKIGLLDTIADNASSGGRRPGQHAGPAGRGRPAAGRLHPAPERRAGRDRRGRRGARLAARPRWSGWPTRSGPAASSSRPARSILPGSVTAAIPVGAGRHRHRDVRRAGQRHRTVRGTGGRELAGSHDEQGDGRRSSAPATSAPT